MRNLFLIAIMVLFFVCTYLLMARIDWFLTLLRKNHLHMEQQRPDPGRKNWNQRQTLPRRFKPTSGLDTECCSYDESMETPVSQIKIKKNHCCMVLTSTQQRFML